MSSIFLVYAAFLSCSVSDSEGKVVVREIATRPLTQDLLSHEVRGSGVPPAPAPHHPPAPCPLSTSGLGWLGWGRKRQTSVSAAPPACALRLLPCAFFPASRTVTSWTREA